MTAGVAVSIVLPTHEAGEDLDPLLDAVYAQEGPTFELIAIDTESSDGTRERLARRPLRLERTTRREFSHPGTRNRGVRLARGDLVVFLVQDALPLNPRWLAALTAPLEDPRVAAAYSRQVPRDGCPPGERRDIERGAPPGRWTKRLGPEGGSDLLALSTFSHVSSCARRALLLEHPLDEGLPMVEDQEWCLRILRAGWTVVYEPASMVAHSHRQTLGQVYRRHRDYGRAFARFHPLPTSLGRALAGAAWETLGDYRYLLASAGSPLAKLAWLPGIPARRLAMKLGFHRGLTARSR